LRWKIIKKFSHCSLIWFTLYVVQNSNIADSGQSDKPNFPRLEETILDFWDQNHIFEQSVNERPKRSSDGQSNEYVFYDGPPFANGLPHYGHLLTGFVKDTIPRFQTMLGKRVERRFGWDCHGLPAEIAAEKELNVSGAQAINQFGVDKFNAYCRNLVTGTTDIWRDYVRRQARWVDMDNDYKTMDPQYMESVIWAFKELYKKGLVYEGQRVLPYCWECETPLSNFETRQDDAYRPRKDPAVIVKVKVKDSKILPDDTFLLIWTTTPWTLPSNLAIAVNPQITYVVAQVLPADRYVIAKDLLSLLSQKLDKEFKVISEFCGNDLKDSSYEPIFDYFKDTQNAFKVITADFVSADEGTGLVHLAPGFGEDDQNACEQHGIETLCPVDARGRFTASVRDLEGTQVFDANQEIINKLKEKGLLVKKEIYEHSYPHCWRTDTPLIYRAISSWFVAVTKIKEDMLRLNQDINWIPSHVKDGAFGKWLEGARDWSISRNRFWGAPIPVWKSDDPNYPRIDVYGSIKELEEDFNVELTDLHRPGIDELKRPNPDDPTGKSMMVRISDVLDCWFESGSMPFASVHYPFENKEWFLEHFPADFIVEYIGQTRGWFYTLHVISTALFGKPPFKNCLTHGVVLGNDGRKLSKRLKNYPDPEEIFANYGADAMRWFLLSGPGLRGQDFSIETEPIAAVVRNVLNPFYNAWHFYRLYSTADEINGQLIKDSEALLDKYIIAKTAELVSRVKSELSAYNISGAAGAIERFLDAVTNWYIRRSRERFWSPKAESAHNPDKLSAYNTLYTVLYYLSKVTAPLLPLLSEFIYKDLTAQLSVHLTLWPEDDSLKSNPSLVESMDLVRSICGQAHAIRKALSIRARQPLSKLVIATESTEVIKEYADIIADEINVKEVEFTNDRATLAKESITLKPAVFGPRLGDATQKIIGLVKEGKWEIEANNLKVGQYILFENEYEKSVVLNDERNTRILPDKNTVIYLDDRLTDELKAEGYARDIVRHIQLSRKQANLNVSDRIDLSIHSNDSEVLKTVESFKDYIKSQVLANSLRVNPDKTFAGFSAEANINKEFKLTISFEKSS
jgi:isoleucyl-tRNA synthetase